MPTISTRRLIRRGSYVVELETRYSLFSRPGKLRTIGWINSAFSGSYRETLDNPGAQSRHCADAHAAAPNTAMSSTSSSRSTDDIGLFGRWSWNDGKNEIMSFTDIDASLSFGASIKGTRVGTARTTPSASVPRFNGLSKDHRDFIAAGGLGILVGDGRLNYAQEKVLETYYAVAVMKDVSFTVDYQLLTNPAYNADRGPVSIFSGRVHAEF